MDQDNIVWHLHNVTKKNRTIQKKQQHESYGLQV